MIPLWFCIGVIALWFAFGFFVHWAAGKRAAERAAMTLKERDDEDRDMSL